jgi:hypothetical protein
MSGRKRGGCGGGGCRGGGGGCPSSGACLVAADYCGSLKGCQHLRGCHGALACSFTRNEGEHGGWYAQILSLPGVPPSTRRRGHGGESAAGCWSGHRRSLASSTFPATRPSLSLPPSPADSGQLRRHLALQTTAWTPYSRPPPVWWLGTVGSAALHEPQPSMILASQRCLRLLQLLYVVSTATISLVLLPPVRARSGRAWMNDGCQNAASTASYSAGDSYSGAATSVSFSSCSWWVLWLSSQILFNPQLWVWHVWEHVRYDLLVPRSLGLSCFNFSLLLAIDAIT